MTTSAPAAVPMAANVEGATAWTEQRLVFHFSPLTEVAAEFNHYNATHSSSKTYTRNIH